MLGVWLKSLRSRLTGDPVLVMLCLQAQVCWEEGDLEQNLDLISVANNRTLNVYIWK